MDLKQGDSLDISARLKSYPDLTGWACQIQVRDSDDNIANSIDRSASLNSDNSAFEDRITDAESGGLALDTYTLSAQLSNSTTNQAVEINKTLTIVKQYNY